MCNFFVLESLQFETFIDGNLVPIVFDLIYNVYFWNHMKKTESIDTGDYLTQKDKYKGQRLIRLPNCQRLPNTTSPRITLAGSKRNESQSNISSTSTTVLQQAIQRGSLR